MPNHDLIAILGPTASVKLLLLPHWFMNRHFKIISADSRQNTEEMDLGTKKIWTRLYSQRQANSVYHLIDIGNPDTSMNLNTNVIFF